MYSLELMGPFEAPYEGPYEVLERITDRVFKVKMNNKTVTVSTERLKPAFLETEIFHTDAERNNPQQESILPTAPTTLRTYPGPNAKKKKTVSFATMILSEAKVTPGE
ncbi:hypothetical protein ABEB36_008389 [Hypothenemus hampei]|uniref:Vitellogenin n=1 Tax=Hypothenemus hampei TaxID=57062 RepID=A0ABD1EMA8_HYPHA